MRTNVSLGWSRLANRKVALALLWTCALLSVAVAFNIIGISSLGSVRAWEHWLTEHRWHFFAWRILFYFGTACGWLWMRRRVIDRDDSAGARTRLKRCEFGAVATVVLVEITTLITAR